MRVNQRKDDLTEVGGGGGGEQKRGGETKKICQDF